MASTNTLCKKILNVKNTVVESHEFYIDADGVNHLRIKARPNAWHKNDCPHCGRRCHGYDIAAANPKVWRALAWGALLVQIECQTHRVVCPEHGIVTAAVPWAYPGSSFTKEFDLTVTWLAEYLPRSAVANFMRIDWQTVGNCIPRSLHTLTSIPGIGKVYSAGIIAEIGDIHRFDTQASVAKFAGLVWHKNQSGVFEAEHSRMIKSGNRYLRYYLLEAANSVRRCDSEFRRYYDLKFKEVNKYQHKRALALTARKLVRLVFRLLKDNRLYIPPED